MDCTQLTTKNCHSQPTNKIRVSTININVNASFTYLLPYKLISINKLESTRVIIVDPRR